MSLPPSGGQTDFDLRQYIMTIYREYVVSSTALQRYFLSTPGKGPGTLKEDFRRFFYDFVRLFKVTCPVSAMTASKDLKTEINAWIANSQTILSLKRRGELVGFAQAGLTLAQDWVEELYNKQLIVSTRL